MRKIQFIARDIWGREIGDRSLTLGSTAGNPISSEPKSKLKIKNYN